MSLIFFVNGCLEVDNNDGYTMRFLTESEEGCKLTISLFDDKDNQIVYKDDILGLKLIRVDCSKFMDKFNRDGDTYRRIKYRAFSRNSFFEGSFPLIAPDHKSPLNFISVSCNNNKSKFDNYDYCFQRVDQPVDLWDHLAKRFSHGADIILHAGDNIYADYVLKNKIGYDKSNDTWDQSEIYQAFAHLYRISYGETSQGIAMRNSLNIMMLDDHEISNSFGTPGTKCTKGVESYENYYRMGLKAYLDYQDRLHRDLTDGEEAKMVAGESFIYYSLDYGKYTIIALDERHTRYHTGLIFPDSELNWLKSTIESSENTDIIIVSPRPIGHLDRTSASIQGLFTDGGKDELLHKDNRTRTIRLLSILNRYKESKNFKIVAGDVHKTFINEIRRKGDTKPIARQLVSSAITRKPKGYLSLFPRLYHSIQQKCVSFGLKDIEIGPRIKQSYNNNYGIIHNDQLDNYKIEGYDLTFSFMNH